MTGQEQRAALQRKIWDIANDVRGSVDGWDFKQYVLGTLFYRFISENFAAYIEADDESINYAELPDDVVTDDIKDDAIKTKGYFIYPSQLFTNIAKNANNNNKNRNSISFPAGEPGPGFERVKFTTPSQMFQKPMQISLHSHSVTDARTSICGQLLHK